MLLRSDQICCCDLRLQVSRVMVASQPAHNTIRQTGVTTVLARTHPSLRLANEGCSMLAGHTVEGCCGKESPQQAVTVAVALTLLPGFRDFGLVV